MWQATSISHFEWRHNGSHWPIKYHHFIRVTFVTRMKSFTEHFIRVWIHTCMNSYAYQIKRVWKNTCMQNSVYDIALWYTYKKLHVWKITRMKSYTYEKLQVGIVTRIKYWVLIGAFLYTYRFFHGTFDTCSYSYVLHFIRVTFWLILSTTVNHSFGHWFSSNFCHWCHM